jgi:predicted CxxxxCH...CXXCH cytochrome family protein
MTPAVAPGGGCPEDITMLFNRPIQQGGCSGVGCHSPGNTSPDLISPNPAERLLNVTSRCNGRPYIGADDSFIKDKLTNVPPECGYPMPFNMPEALSASDEACILGWIAQVAGE